MGNCQKGFSSIFFHEDPTALPAALRKYCPAFFRRRCGGGGGGGLRQPEALADGSATPKLMLNPAAKREEANHLRLRMPRFGTYLRRTSWGAHSARAASNCQPLLRQPLVS